MSVQIGAITPSNTKTDVTSGHQLNGAYGVYALSVGGATYVYVAGHDDNGMSVFALNGDGTLTNIQNISDDTALELIGASQIVSTNIGGTHYLYVNSAVDDGLSVFRVNGDGTLVNVQNITDTMAIELNGPEGKMQVATVGGNTYLISPADDDNGIATWRIDADGTLTNVYNLTDNATLQLHSASDAEVVVVGTDTYVYVAAEDDPGISVFELNANGTLTNIQNIPDDATLQINGTAGLAVAAVAGVTYVIASGAGVLDAGGVPTSPEGLSVFSVGPTGQLTNVFNLHDTAELGLFGAVGLTSFTLDGESFVAVSAKADNALSVYHVGLGGTLTEVTTIFDSASVTLNGTVYNEFAVVGGTPMLIASGRVDDGITAFTIGKGNDVLTGAGSADLLMGLQGNDTLKGADGNDTLIGGSGGDDLDGGNGVDEARFSGAFASYDIVAEADGSHTVIDRRTGSPDGTDHLVSVERLRFADGVRTPGGTPTSEAPSDIIVHGGTVQENASAGTVVATLVAEDRDPGDTFRFSITDAVGNPSTLFTVVGNEVRVKDGARLDYEAQTSHTVRITVTDGAGGSHSEELVIAVQDIDENAANVIIGTSAANPLVGTSGVDEIWGRGGNDTLSGLGSNDELYGEGGVDRLDGGMGDDAMVGGLGNDTYVVDSAGDTLTELAGEGLDTVRTTLASYSLAALANVEHLAYDGAGSFSGTGNTLANTVTGGSGSDSLDGGSGKDALNGGAGTDVLLGGLGADTLNGGADADDFVYTAVNHSLPGTGQDRISGFASGSDDIVITAIDANTGVAGDQAFVLDTNSSFSTGEIRQRVSNGNLLIEFNTDGDTSAEMSILLQGVTSPLGGDDFER